MSWAGKKGLVVLVTCDYRGTSQKPLPQTNVDARDMRTTFEKFGFTVDQITNDKAKEGHIKEKLDHLSAFLNKYNGEKDIEVLIFAFSGHGIHAEDDNLLLAHDGKALSLKDDIIPKFVVNPELFEIPKLFFIDACRGDKELKVYVDKRIKKGNDGKTDNTLVGNYLIANATIKHHVSYDGKWMQKLAEMIGEDTSRAPLPLILDNLTKATDKDLQPEYVSRLRGSYTFPTPPEDAVYTTTAATGR